MEVLAPLGWHLIYSRKKRRLFYLIPTRGDFRLSPDPRGKAIAALQAGTSFQGKCCSAEGGEALPRRHGRSRSPGATIDVELAVALLRPRSSTNHRVGLISVANGGLPSSARRLRRSIRRGVEEA